MFYQPWPGPASTCSQRRFGCLKKLFNFLRGLENGRFPVLVFGPESVSDERSRRENRTILREISARVFFGKIPKYRKKHISNISRTSGNSRKHVPKIIQGSTTQPLEPPARRAPARRPYFQVMDNVADFNFQYFQDMRK